MVKTCKIFMLPTGNETGELWKNRATDSIHSDVMNLVKNKLYYGYHLYVVSDGDFEIDDYFLEGEIQNLKPRKIQTRDLLEDLYDYEKERKIIATTDSSLGLYQPSKEFIEDFIIRYNNRNVTTEVLVEYVDETISNVIMKKIKQNFSREELRPILLKLVHDVSDVMNREDTTGFELNPWMENNL